MTWRWELRGHLRVRKCPSRAPASPCQCPGGMAEPALLGTIAPTGFLSVDCCTEEDVEESRCGMRLPVICVLSAESSFEAWFIDAQPAINAAAMAAGRR